MQIAQAIKEGGEEAEIAYLVSLWSDQMDSDTGDNLPGHEEVTGRLVTEPRKQEFWEQSRGLVMCTFLFGIYCVIASSTASCLLSTECPVSCLCHVTLISRGYMPHVCFSASCFDGSLLLDDHPRICVLGFLGSRYQDWDWSGVVQYKYPTYFALVSPSCDFVHLWPFGIPSSLKESIGLSVLSTSV